MVPSSLTTKPYGSRNAMMRKIHQKNCELPMAAAGAAASATNTTVMTDRIASTNRNFLFFAIRSLFQISRTLT